MRHIISVLLENEPGALSRVVGLFSQRNYNIESLTVAPTEDHSLSRLTLTTIGDDQYCNYVEQTSLQLETKHRVHFPLIQKLYGAYQVRSDLLKIISFIAPPLIAIG